MLFMIETLDLNLLVLGTMKCLEQGREAMTFLAKKWKL